MLAEFPIDVIDNERIPRLLREIPDGPDKVDKLFIRGNLPPPDNICLTIVGSRRATPYGREAMEMILAGLSGYPISIVSGLAIGTDSIAHQSALAVGLHCIAFPGSGIDDDTIYPPSSQGLARNILRAGGCLMSEYDTAEGAMPYMFPRRNRLMAGMSKATLIIEAGEKSGTLITAYKALEYNRDVFVVPSNIFSPLSAGTHRLLRQGAAPISSSKELLDALGFETDLYQFKK